MLSFIKKLFGIKPAAAEPVTNEVASTQLVAEGAGLVEVKAKKPRAKKASTATPAAKKPRTTKAK